MSRAWSRISSKVIPTPPWVHGIGFRFLLQQGNSANSSMPWRNWHEEYSSFGLDHRIGRFMLFEVDSEARAPAPPIPILLRTSSAASDRKSAPLPSSRQAG